MADGFDLRLIGDRELDRKFGRLERRVQRKYVSRAFREHLKTIRSRIVANLSGDPIEPLTGRLRAAMASAKVRAQSRNPRKRIRLGLVMPTRAELNIPPAARGYYPAVLEYGREGVPPKPFMRPAIDRYRSLDVRRIGQLIYRQLRRGEGASRR